MLNLNFDPFPVLTTERLVLRRLELTDADEMYRFRSDKDLMKYIPHGLAVRRENIIELIENVNRRVNNSECIHWAITLKGDDTIIGTAGYVEFYKDNLRAEIGYLLHTGHHGKGIMQEAVHAIIEYGFKILNLHSIEAVVNTANRPSSNLLLKYGFTKDAYFKDYLHHNGGFIDVFVYSLLSSKPI